jgi:hypothetical protein
MWRGLPVTFGGRPGTPGPVEIEFVLALSSLTARSDYVLAMRACGALGIAKAGRCLIRRNGQTCCPISRPGVHFRVAAAGVAAASMTEELGELPGVRGYGVRCISMCARSQARAAVMIFEVLEHPSLPEVAHEMVFGCVGWTEPHGENRLRSQQEIDIAPVECSGRWLGSVCFPRPVLRTALR